MNELSRGVSHRYGGAVNFLSYIDEVLCCRFINYHLFASVGSGSICHFDFGLYVGFLTGFCHLLFNQEHSVAQASVHIVSESSDFPS
jgi:hypothetical protein